MFLVGKLGIAGRMPPPLMVRTRAAIADCKKHKKATEKADQAQPEEERPTAGRPPERPGLPFEWSAIFSCIFPGLSGPLPAIFHCAAFQHTLLTHVVSQVLFSAAQRFFYILWQFLSKFFATCATLR